MKITIPLVLFFLVNAGAVAQTICLGQSEDLRLEMYSDGIFFQRSIGNGQTQQFFTPLIDEKGSKKYYGAYSTGFVIEGSKLEHFVEEEIVATHELNCRQVSLEKLAPSKSGFPKAIRGSDLETHPHNNPSFFEMNMRFDYNFMAKNLADIISDIGDWYSVVPTKEESQMIQKYVEENHFEILEKLNRYSHMKFEGFVFARDWYYGYGNIGLLYSAGKKLMLYPIEFDGQIKFGSSNLDYVY